MENDISIKPVALHIWTADRLRFQLVRLELGNCATFHFELHGKEGLLMQGNVTMDGADYQAWNEDAPYITAWILKALQLEAAPVPAFVMAQPRDLEAKTAEEQPTAEAPPAE